MTRQEFDLIKEVINERLKMVINNRVMERLFNCLRNGIYVTCNMYDELKEME